MLCPDVVKLCKNSKKRKSWELFFANDRFPIGIREVFRTLLNAYNFRKKRSIVDV